MPTIKDVARLAGVSSGTVSNVINGRKNVSSDTVFRVKTAMKELGYQPDVMARSLKKNSTKSIGVVLPNILDARLAQLFSGIERTLRKQHYLVSLFCTDESEQNEKMILDQVQQQRMTGMLIMTCQPNAKTTFRRMKQAGIQIVFIEREPTDNDGNLFIAFDMAAQIEYIVKELLEKGYEHIGLLAGREDYSYEQTCVDAYIQALCSNSDVHCQPDVQRVEFSKESAFRAAAWWMLKTEPPDVIITTSPLLAQGILMACTLLGPEKHPKIVTISERTWTQSSRTVNMASVPQDYLRLGEDAASLLINALQNAGRDSYRHIVANENNRIIWPQCNQKNQGRISRPDAHTIRVLMHECEPAHATQSLLCDFQLKTGYSVEITFLSHADLYQRILYEADASAYDVFHIDIPWFPEFACRGMLKDISSYLHSDPHMLDIFVPGTLGEYANYQGRCFGIPFMDGTQLLYYRKDLFEDTGLQRLFFEQNKWELHPPRTWVEFNTIARFFTKKFNPMSPTEYGTTLGGKYSSGAVCEYLPRLWAFGGHPFSDDGRVKLSRPESVQALKNYIESFQYASPDSPDNWWEDQLQEFSDGNAAMMINFVALSMNLTDRNKSKICGKIGFAMAPGRNPLLGGWSLGINAKSQNPEKAFEFLKWACCSELSVPHTILGGLIPLRYLYSHAELSSTYPWLPKALDAFTISRKRVIPLKDTNALNYNLYESILGDAVYAAITGRKNPEEALQEAETKLNGFIGNL